ncbi:ATP synthase subunit B family protein [Flaviflexus equikiangi]|uniref:ATPase n=1 Tax=Flaviflexus equikiangi TaxID=2758573 RepID=A0ABS2TDY1_9ACTO|nr:hypothetical protein [Flaviflexus equikiangi]MBM9432860.1 hypothetical protein [Flaviflexus equikiangi]
MSENEFDIVNAAAGDSLIAVLDEIIETVTLARGVPMSASAMINRSEVLDLLETARDIVPDQIEAADTIIAEASEVKADAQRRAKTILERAHADAEETVQQARRHAADLVSEHAVTKAAHAEAERILAETRSQAQRMNAGADRYSDDSLAYLQSELEGLLSKVHAGRQELSRREENRVAKERAGSASASDAVREDVVSDDDSQPTLNEVRFDDEFEPPFDNEK